MTIQNKNLIILVENLSKCFSGEDRLFPFWFIETMQANFASLYEKAIAVRSDERAAADQEKFLEETTNIEDIIFIEYDKIKDLNLTFNEAKWLKHFIQKGE